MIIPKGIDRSLSKAAWKYLQRMERCTNRIMQPKWEKAWTDQLVYGQGSYEITEQDMNAVANLMKGGRP